MSCGASLVCLQDMDCKLESIYSILDDIKLALGGASSGGLSYDTYQTWARIKKGASTWYEQTLTFAGSTMTVQLDLPVGQILNDIVLIFDDATSRDFQMRAYTNPADGMYAQIRSETSNTGTDYRACSIREKFPINSRLELYFANYTVSKRCKITIQADDI